MLVSTVHKDVVYLFLKLFKGAMSPLAHFFCAYSFNFDNIPERLENVLCVVASSLSTKMMHVRRFSNFLDSTLEKVGLTFSSLEDQQV